MSHTLKFVASPELIPRLVGKGGISLKCFVYDPSWEKYKALSHEVRGKEGLSDDLLKRYYDASRGDRIRLLRVQLEAVDETIEATIICESTILMKFAIHHLKIHFEKTQKPRSSSYTLYATYPKEKIGILVGKRGSRIKANVEKASQKMPENKRPIFEKAWVSVDGCDKNHATVKTDVAKSPYKMFLGWEPEESDEEESEMIEVRVSAKASKDDTLEFIGYLSEILDEIIQEVNTKQQKASEDALALLNDLEGLGDDMDDMSEGYSPESP